jgi:hypothetical protein
MAQMVPASLLARRNELQKARRILVPVHIPDRLHRDECDHWVLLEFDGLISIYKIPVDT